MSKLRNRITIRVSDKIQEALAWKSIKEKRTVSYTVREIVERFFSKK